MLKLGAEKKAPPAAPRLGQVQLRIMRVLWARGRATAREVTEALNATAHKVKTRREEIAHSTVQTLLRQLENKGAVHHEVENRTFVFVPLLAENEATVGATRDLLSRVFQNSVPGLVAHLLQHEAISPAEMQQLRALIERQESATGAKPPAKEDADEPIS